MPNFQTITIANTMPDLVSRVAEIIEYLNGGGGAAAGDANNALHLNGKTEGQLNVNSAIFANNTTYLNGQPDSYYTNASNLSSGTVPIARLPVANTTANGIVTTSVQSFSGDKTFTANVVIDGALTVGGVLFTNPNDVAIAMAIALG